MDAQEPENALARIERAASRVEALESFSAETGRLRRALEEARGADPGEATGKADDLETRLRLAEEELRELAQGFFRAPAIPAGSPIPAEELRRIVLGETVALLKDTFSSASFRALAESAAREAATREAGALAGKGAETMRGEHQKSQIDLEMLERQLASLDATVAGVQDRLTGADARLEERILKLEQSVTSRLEEGLREEHRQALLDIETQERQLASVEAAVAALQDRSQAPDAGALEALRREVEARMAAVPGSEAIEAAVRKAGAALDAQLSERLAGMLTAQPPTAAPDPAAFLQQIRELVQEAVADAFPVDELGRIIEQKIAKRGEAMHAELREVEGSLVKAIMQQLEAKPVGEAQVLNLVDQRINQLLMKYIQR